MRRKLSDRINFTNVNIYSSGRASAQEQFMQKYT